MAFRDRVVRPVGAVAAAARQGEQRCAAREAGRPQAHRAADRRVQVQQRYGLPADAAGSHARSPDQQGHPQAVLVHRDLPPRPVRAGLLAVVRGVDDQRIAGQSVGVHGIEHAAHVAVHLLDLRVVGAVRLRDPVRPAGVAGRPQAAHPFGFGQVLEGLQVLGRQRRDSVPVVPVALGVGTPRRMWLVVVHGQHPWAIRGAAGLQEPHRFLRDPFLGAVRFAGRAGRRHLPELLHRAGTGHRRAVAKQAGHVPVPPDLDRHRQFDAGGAAFGEVQLAGHGMQHAVLPQVGAPVRPAAVVRGRVVPAADLVRVPAREPARPRRSADRVRAPTGVEPGPLRGQPVQVGSPGSASVAAGELGVMLVGDDADDVHGRIPIGDAIRLRTSLGHAKSVASRDHIRCSSARSAILRR